jgi:taurine transport system substrate-binding protein
VLAVVLAFLALLGACGSDSERSTDEPSGSSSGNSSDTTVGDDEAAPDTIVIGYQAIPNGDLVVKNQGWLEEAFPNTEIEWKLFDSGGSVNEAILSGSIDIGLAGSSPVSRGLSTELPYQVPWIHDVIGEAEALVVNPDAGIAEIAGLEGKTIATPFASTAHFSLLAALEDAGVDASSVDIIDAEPDDIYAAWTRGDIDGTYVWNPNLALIVEEGGEILVTSAELAEKGKTTYDLAVVANDFAEEFPGAVETWLAQQDRAVQLIQDDQQAAAEAIAAELNLTAEEVIPQLEGLVFLDASEQVGADYLGGGLATNLFAAAQFNAELGEIPEAAPEATYQDAVEVSFAEAVAGG